MLNGADEEQTIEALRNASSELGIFLTCHPEHDLLNYEILGVTELVYCRDPGASPLPCGTHPDHEKIISSENCPADCSLLLSPVGTTLRKEQDRLFSSLFREHPRVAAEADFPILRRLAELGGGDTILPLNMLSKETAQGAFHFYPPEKLFLVLADNPSRRLPSSVVELIDFIRRELMWKTP